jgi:hypothetical protein
MRFVTHALVSVIWVGSFAGAYACQCGDPIGIKYDEISRLRLERARDVVQGRIVEVHADTSTIRDGMPLAMAKMKVSSVVKGKVPTGDLTIVTANGGDGSCGMSSFLMSGVASGQELIFSVTKTSMHRNKREYEISSCGYFAYARRN